MRWDDLRWRYQSSVSSVSIAEVICLRLASNLACASTERDPSYISLMCVILADFDRLSCLLDLDQKRLELRRLRVGVADRGGQRIGQEPRFGHPHESPMNWHTHRVHHLAVDGHGPDALGHHRHRLDIAAVRTDLDALAAGDADLPGQRRADFDELLRLQN